MHYATINKDKELIEKIVYWDSDTGKIRKQKDSKNKTPWEYDPPNLFLSIFNTIWDFAQVGDIMKFKTALRQGKFPLTARTYKEQNTVLHLAISNK